MFALPFTKAAREKKRLKVILKTTREFIYAHEDLPEDKKAGRIPMREIEGPAKNLLLERQGNAQQDTKTQCFLAGISILGAKGLLFKLGRFTISFAEITDVMSLKSDS